MTFLYPHNILFVALAAGISLYLGFLPVQTTPRKFFVHLSFITIILWGVAAFLSGLKVGGYILGCGMIATTAWRQFCFDRTFIAKLWLSAAAAFGGTLILLMLVAVPRGPEGSAVWFYTSIYFGAFTLTVSFMAAALAVSALRGEQISAAFLDNALVFSFLAFGLRLLLLTAIWFGFPKLFPVWGAQVTEYLAHNRLNQLVGWVGLGMIVPFAINFWARLQLKKGVSVGLLWRPLSISFLAVLAGEFLARLIYL